jgi:hypothetical protein
MLGKSYYIVVIYLKFRKRRLIEMRDAARFENAEEIKLSVFRKLKLRYARFCSRQEWSKGSSEFLRKHRLGF